MDLIVNARVTAGAMGGQQRVAAEIVKRLGPVECVSPAKPLAGVKGHLWEQFVLPFHARGKLLWSPSATGPIACRHQVVTLHDIAWIDAPEFFSANFTRFYNAIIPPLLRRAARVVTVSEFSRQRISKAFHLPAEAIDVVANGVTDNFRRYPADEIAGMRAALGLPERYVLLQATSDKRKNLHRTLEAWKAAQSRLDPEIVLAVSGNLARAHVFGNIGPIEADPRTRLLGYVDEKFMGPLMAGASAFLFPTIYEGFGLPIIEAMACGAPVLTAAASATTEVAGGAALLVDPLDVGSIAEGLVTLMRDADLRERLAAAGFARAKDFSWDFAAAQYRAIFDEIAQPHPDRAPKRSPAAQAPRMRDAV